MKMMSEVQHVPGSPFFRSRRSSNVIRVSCKKEDKTPDGEERDLEGDTGAVQKARETRRSTRFTTKPEVRRRHNHIERAKLQTQTNE